MGSLASRTRRPITWLVEGLSGTARRVLRRDSRPGDLLRRWRHSLVRTAPDRPIEQVIDAFARTTPTASFVQVGSNDGVKFDPISLQVRTRRWTGVMVEPVPYLFERLTTNFGGSRRVRLENAAVAAHGGSQPFYFLAESPGSEPDLPDWYDALGSFRKDVVLSHREHIPDIDARLREIEVPCLTFDELCRKHAVERIDLVHIDTEGYDFEVIKLVDLDRWQPSVLLYEHKHLSQDDQAAARQLLDAQGFDLLADDTDTLAVRRTAMTANGALGAAWQAARAALPSP
jgi:FkbM family methyltransferase